MKYVNTTLYVVILLSSCARAPLRHMEEAMRPAKVLPIIRDSFPPQDFLATLKKHIAVMKTSPKVSDPMIFGKTKIEKNKYIAALEEILNHETDLIPWINNNFNMYEIYGREQWAEVLATGYYEPHVMGARQKTPEFSRPMYALPPDLEITYFDRKEIDVDNKLQGKNLELIWVDPVDAFFIQIQGSGLVETHDGEKMRVGYAGKNGHPYEPIGKFLTDIIPIEKMSMQKIKAHLKTLSSYDQQELLNKNPSYVFFKKLEGEALTSAGMEVSDERTIATDNNFFPKGALAFLEIEDPITKDQKPRLVFDQDTGGAIRGGGRIDLYCGKGEIASQKAGIMKHPGRLYYLVPKTE